MADTRIFRVTRADGSIEYANRRQVSGRASSEGKWLEGRVVVVDATNEEATAGWTDVTNEFLKGEK